MSPSLPLLNGFGPGSNAGIVAFAGRTGIVRDENRNWRSGLLRSPRLTRLSLIGSEEATKPCALTWLPPPKMMPFRLMTYTWPWASMEPRICDGTPEGSVTLLNTIQSLTWAPPAPWSKSRVVLFPTLNVCQFRIACWAVCWMVTFTWPLLRLDCAGRLAPCQRAEFAVAP